MSNEQLLLTVRDNQDRIVSKVCREGDELVISGTLAGILVDAIIALTSTVEVSHTLGVEK